MQIAYSVQGPLHPAPVQLWPSSAHCSVPACLPPSPQGSVLLPQKCNRCLVFPPSPSPKSPGPQSVGSTSCTQLAEELCLSASRLSQGGPFQGGTKWVSYWRMLACGHQPLFSSAVMTSVSIRLSSQANFWFLQGKTLWHCVDGTGVDILQIQWTGLACSPQEKSFHVLLQLENEREEAVLCGAWVSCIWLSDRSIGKANGCH